MELSFSHFFHVPINLFSRGRKTLVIDKKNPIMVPILAPAATRRIRKRLLFHNSLKLSISDSAVRSSIETPLNFASTIPANHPQPEEDVWK